MHPKKECSVILQCTKLALEKIKPKIIDTDANEFSDIDRYHCNVIKFGRINSLLITNDKTLFSYFIYDLKANDFKHIEEIIREFVFKMLVHQGFSQEQFEKVLKSMEHFSYSKSSSRSVLAYMNDMKRQIEGYLYRGDDIFEINCNLNDIPYSGIKYHSASKLFRELLS